MKIAWSGRHARFLWLAMLLGTAIGADAQDAAVAHDYGWTRALSSDGKHYVWTNGDTGGRGAQFAWNMDGWVFEIHTKESLLDMADVDDGKIKVALLSVTADRLAVDGVLSRDQHGVSMNNRMSNKVRDWLTKQENHNQADVTVILANNGLREVYRFSNVNLTTEEELFTYSNPTDRQKPKRPKDPTR